MQAGRRRRFITPFMVAVIVAVSSIGAAGSPRAAGAADLRAQLVGAGSTFDQPFFSRAFAAYSRMQPVDITYHAVGSGAGVTQFSAGAVDFGASDVPMNECLRA
jgi:phosphate transport system substrate-binding protein